MKYAAYQSASRAAVALLATVAMSSVTYAQISGLPLPVSHWTFDSNLNDYNQTTVVDEGSMPGANGSSDAVWADTDPNDLRYTRGFLGGAARLAGGASNWFQIDEIPGIAGIRTIPENPTLPTAGVGITFSAWINPFQAQGEANYQGVIMSRDVTQRLADAPNDDLTGTNWGLAYRDTTNQFSNSIDSRAGTNVAGQIANNNLASANEAVSPNTWHHLALVWGTDADSVNDFSVPQKLYIDGQFIGERGNTNVGEFVSSGEWFIGQDDARAFVGLIDDVAVFSSALTASQISSLYTAGTNGNNAAGALTPAILAGDTNGNGVGIDDFNVIRDNLGLRGAQVTALSQGDLNGGRDVDLNDYQRWLQAFTANGAAQSAAIGAAAVPEPSSVALMGVFACTVGVMLRRRHR